MLTAASEVGPGAPRVASDRLTGRFIADREASLREANARPAFARRKGRVWDGGRAAGKPREQIRLRFHESGIMGNTHINNNKHTSSNTYIHIYVYIAIVGGNNNNNNNSSIPIIAVVAITTITIVTIITAIILIT